MDNNLIEFKNITKTFGAVKALNNISFGIRRGEILSLLGENGSGKTTLMNVLSGIYHQDDGEVLINGKVVQIQSPKDAFRNRIGMVHQHFKLVDVFTGIENVDLGLSKEDYAFFKNEAASLQVENFKTIFKGISTKTTGVEIDEKLNKKIKEIIDVCRQNNVDVSDDIINHFANEDITVFENAYKEYSRVLKSVGTFNLKESAIRVNELCKTYGFVLNVNKKVYDMSVSEKQTLEIVKILYRGADILILDEPTAVLTPQETNQLFKILKNMKEMGKTIIIITHKLNEVLELSDRVAVLRKGEFVDAVDTKDSTEKSLTEMMVGKKVTLHIDRKEPKDTKLRLGIKNLTVTNSFGIKTLDNVSFDVYGGEILGIAGISGCGQKELLESIAGLQRADSSSSITYYQRHNTRTKELVGMSARKIHELGIHLSFVPEDRLGMGLVGSMGMTDNMLLKSYSGSKKDKKGFFISKKEPEQLAKKIKKELEVVTPSIQTPVRLLSGGNVQKVLVGREIASSPAVLLTAYAVRGLDINSSYLIYNLLNEQKEKGVAVIYVGEDLDVLLALCDKIVVLCDGKVNGILDARTTDKFEVGKRMTNLMEN